jgi:Fic family protein
MNRIACSLQGRGSYFRNKTPEQRICAAHLDAGRDGFEGGLTTSKYVSMARVSRATAFREISDLVEKRILLQNEGRDRNANYGIRSRED